MTNIGNVLIQEIDTIFRGPSVGDETVNAQRNYAREVKDPTIASYIVGKANLRMKSTANHLHPEGHYGCTLSPS